MPRKLIISLLVGTTTFLSSAAIIASDSASAPADAANSDSVVADVLEHEPVAQVPEDEIFKVTTGQTSSAAILGGTVIPYKMVNLIAQMPGDVKYIAGEEGDSFPAGTRLVIQDEAALLEKRKAAVAAYESARAGLANAQVMYRRELLNPNTQANSMLGGAPSMFSMFSDPFREFSGEGDPDYERYSNLYGQSTQMQTARNQIEQALAGINELDENIRNLSSIAPFDGVIVKKMVEVGDVAQPGMPLVVFADTSLMQIQVEVPARLVGNLRENTFVRARLDGSNQVIQARVARIFPMANQGGHTTTVKFDLPPSSGARPGMYAEVSIPDPSSNSRPRVVIPESAINWRGSLPAVFQVSQDRTQIRMRTLRLGKPVGNGMVSVISGVNVGDMILKEPLASTRSGPYQSPVE